MLCGGLKGPRHKSVCLAPWFTGLQPREPPGSDANHGILTCHYSTRRSCLPLTIERPYIWKTRAAGCCNSTTQRTYKAQRSCLRRLGKGLGAGSGRKQGDKSDGAKREVHGRVGGQLCSRTRPGRKCRGEGLNFLNRSCGCSAAAQGAATSVAFQGRGKGD
jgi:hypothetical protein